MESPEIRNVKFQAWKVLENPGKVLEF